MEHPIPDDDDLLLTIRSITFFPDNHIEAELVDKAFRKNAVKKKVGKNKTKATYTLKKNTTYYIRMRYVGKDGVSKWTKAKKVKTKK